MRNFIRVTQHGYHTAEEMSARVGRLECMERHEFFFDNNDAYRIADALRQANELMMRLHPTAMRGRPRMVAYHPVPGHLTIPTIGVDYTSDFHAVAE